MSFWRIGVLLACLVVPGASLAQENFPSRPVRIVIPYAPGSVADVFARIVALAKAKPGTLNYSHPGKGSTGHLGFELFKRLAGIDVTGIGYRGYPQMVPDIASGLITSTFASANQALAQVQTGAIRIIGTISDGRSKYFPDVPTMAEQGFVDAQVTPWFGVVLPVGTPQPTVERISKALEAALATADVREKLDIAGCEAKS